LLYPTAGTDTAEVENDTEVEGNEKLSAVVVVVGGGVVVVVVVVGVVVDDVVTVQQSLHRQLDISNRFLERASVSLPPNAQNCSRS